MSLLLCQNKRQRQTDVCITCTLTVACLFFCRSFTPLTGRLIYAILNAHNKGVSALATTSHGRILISGGCEGQVRLWQVSPHRQELMCTLKVFVIVISMVVKSTIKSAIFRNIKVQYRRFISTNLTRKR